MWHFNIFNKIFLLLYSYHIMYYKEMFQKQKNKKGIPF